VRILQKLALLYGERLGSQEQATAAWRRILALEPKHGRALRAVRDSLLAARDWDGLQALYTGVRDFEGLVDVLSHEADQAQHAQLKVDLSFRAARVFEQNVGDPARALRSYERVLSVDPKNLRAAAALATLYEQDAKWARLRAMLEILRAGATEKDKQLALLDRLRQLCIGQLRDGDAALGYAVEAYRLAPESEQTRAALESAAETALAFDKVVELYLARAEKADADEAAFLRRRAATIALERLGQSSVAMGELEKLLKAKPDDLEVTAVLERLYRAESRTADLRKLLVHRLEHVEDKSARWATLKELAQIEEDKLADAESAAGRYRALSEIDPSDRDVLVARDRLALAGERWEELVEVLERRLDLDLEPSVRVELSARLGHVLLDRLGKPERALQVFERVLEQDQQHGATVTALERVAEQQPKLALRAPSACSSRSTSAAVASTSCSRSCSEGCKARRTRSRYTSCACGSRRSAAASSATRPVPTARSRRPSWRSRPIASCGSGFRRPPNAQASSARSPRRSRPWSRPVTSATRTGSSWRRAPRASTTTCWASPRRPRDCTSACSPEIR
jgi:tetratricopeptide (TPR) repeat protein